MLSFRHSLIGRSGLALAAVALVALMNIGLSMTVARSIQGSATAINVAGSLRMLSYQNLAEWQQSYGNGLPEATLDRFDERLEKLQSLRVLPTSGDQPLNQQWALINQTWQHALRPLLSVSALDTTTDTALAITRELVSEIEHLVTLLEDRTEARIALMNVVQGISLLFTLLVVCIMMYDLKNHVVGPLNRLLRVATSVGKGDFTQRVQLSGDDELSQLGCAFDQMTDELAHSYGSLEAHAAAKTRELQLSHSALQLLHSASRSLFSSGDLCEGAIPLLQELEELLSIGPIRLYLHDRHASEPVEVVTTATRQRPYYCRDHSCTACLVAPEAYEELPSEENDGQRLLLPIRTANQLLGTLEVWYPKERELPDTSRRLLETLSDQLATAIFLQRQITEQQQLTLAEERAVIARELHDSLAQSLSYLKMQVARMRKLTPSPASEAQYESILDELSTGLNSAYRQLRELLTTFRLKLDNPDLGTALRETVLEFSDRLANPIQLHYQLPPQLLSANEEIHTLQIIREALANTVKHSQASEISVEVSFRSPQVMAWVRDNGVGLPEGDAPKRHYGLIIMQDRARTLGGRLEVNNRAEGGVEVQLSFVPNSRHLMTEQNQTRRIV
ncbi:MAG: histidine kinase [Marinobacter sp.]|nr:histidine kinase [Marinobacter sp.]